MKFSKKLKLIRKSNNMTQDEFAKSIGVSRGHLANIERGIILPTPLFINCLSLMYRIDKIWLMDDNNDDLSALNGSADMLSQIISRYEQLNDKYKLFVKEQISQLLDLQNSWKS